MESSSLLWETWQLQKSVLKKDGNLGQDEGAKFNLQYQQNETKRNKTQRNSRLK